MSDDHTKHPTELPDDLLISMGFYRAVSPSGRLYWTHKRSPGKFFYHILSPQSTADALIEIGYDELRQKVVEFAKEASR